MDFQYITFPFRVWRATTYRKNLRTKIACFPMHFGMFFRRLIWWQWDASQNYYAFALLYNPLKWRIFCNRTPDTKLWWNIVAQLGPLWYAQRQMRQGDWDAMNKGEKEAQFAFRIYAA